MIEDTLREKLAEAENRLRALESENRRLRCVIDSREKQIQELKPGYYVLTDEGEFNGPCLKPQDAVRCFVPRGHPEDGISSTLIQVIKRYDANDCENYDRCCEIFGDNYSWAWTLNPPAWQDA